MMRLCVLGDGAATGVIAARIAAAGLAEVSQVTKDAQLDAVRASGLRVTGFFGEIVAEIAATDDPATLGPQDYLLLATGAGAVSAELGKLSCLLGPTTCVLTTQPGVPWWYFHCHDGPFDNLTVDAVDPLGRIWETIGPARAMGIVAQIDADFVAPGVIAHRQGETVWLGEPSGEITSRAGDFADTLGAAGLPATVSPEIRPRIWASMRTATLRGLQDEAGLTDLAVGVSQEIIEIAAGLGIERTAFGDEPAQAGIKRMHPENLATQIAALCELARMLDLATPHLDRVQVLEGRDETLPPM